MTRAFTDMDETARELDVHLQALRDHIKPQDGTPEDTALCSIETFCAVALRVMRKTNPSKVRSEARTVEIAARIAGVPVIREAA